MSAALTDAVDTSKLKAGDPHPIHPATESVITLLPGDKITIAGRTFVLKTAVAATTKEIGLVRLDEPGADGVVNIGQPKK